MQIAEQEYTPEVLQTTAELLKINPEYYTMWNHRRRIYASEIDALNRGITDGSVKREDHDSQILDIIQLDLLFLFPLLVKFPKCYWIWDHRLWLLEQATLQLPPAMARKLWEEELALVGKMLTRDSRNFLGWGYRRTVVASLESEALNGKSMSEAEFEYTTKMINLNLSNFSAWHNRTKLILRILDEKAATDEERRQMLDDGKFLDFEVGWQKRNADDVELDLIHKALFDPYDQSLWFYHQNLMCTFDPDLAQQTMAPTLNKAERLAYVARERGFIEDLLEDVKDTKWIYQALIECALVTAKIEGFLSVKAKEDVLKWLVELRELDPLRRGRWEDLEESLA